MYARLKGARGADVHEPLGALFGRFGQFADQQADEVAGLVPITAGDVLL